MSATYVLCFPAGGSLCVAVADCGSTPTWPDRQSASLAARRLGLAAKPRRVGKGWRLVCPAAWTPAMAFEAARRESGGDIVTRRGSSGGLR